MRVQDIPIKWESRASTVSREMTGRYVPRKVGTYSVGVTYKGVHIKNSPWQLTVVPNTGRATRSTLAGLPSRFTAGTPVIVELLARDIFGNLTAGGDSVSILADNATEGDARSWSLRSN